MVEHTHICNKTINSYAISTSACYKIKYGQRPQLSYDLFQNEVSENVGLFQRRRLVRTMLAFLGLIESEQSTYTYRV